MKFNRLICFIIALSFSGAVAAQDVHFSQFYNAPLLLNPSLTGKINGSFRAGVIYRNQWFGALNGRTAFSTPMVSFDMPIRLNNGDAFGVGGYVVNDRSSGGLLSRIQVVLSGAYHKGFGDDNNHSLSLGFQAGFNQRKLDAAGMNFSTMLGDNFNFDPSLPSQENFGETNTNFDLSTGLSWSSKLSEKFYMSFGVAAYNLITPYNTFNTNEEDNMRRITATFSSDIRLSQKFSLLPSVIYQNQAKAQETNLGLAGAIDFSKDFVFFAGAYYRVKDAVIPYIGADYKGFRMGLSYDFNASSLNQIETSKNVGAVEVSLMYIGRYIAIPDVNAALYCPRF
jgi:type IX secretion system PorP/SprF family membrane protein